MSSAGPGRLPCVLVEVVATLRVGAEVPGLLVVEAVARLQLAARRLGWSVVLRDADPALRELLDLAGLADVLALEPRREAEGGEEAGVEEVVQLDDPPA